jgi:transcriptional regulator with XRE-family HTH domain
MPGRRETLTGSKGSRATGIISGFVLKLARQSTALTQEQLAERLAVDVSTIQGWESGRRPLAAMHAGEFLRLSSQLSRLGAPASTGRHLREAIEADHVLSVGIVAGDTLPGAADIHPLAAGVHRRTTTSLITWPIVERTPQHLQVFAGATRRRGPVPSCPVLLPEERVRFLDHLLVVAERSTRPIEALARRQAVYLLGYDTRTHVVDWLRTETNRAIRRPPVSGDLSGLLESRSACVALASAGDGSRLHDFVEHATDTRADIVNLNYWAHWLGELSDDQTDDTFMLDDTRAWTGLRLLDYLANRLEPDAVHLPLDVHTLHTLIAYRPNLLSERPIVLTTLATMLDRLSTTGDLARTVRDQVAGLQYALRIANR